MYSTHVYKLLNGSVHGTAKYNKFLLSEQIAIWFITFTTFITFKPEMYQINPILHGQSPSFRFPVNKVFLC